MFIAALFTIARTWKKPRCPSANEWIRKLWYIYTMKYYFAPVQMAVITKSTNDGGESVEKGEHCCTVGGNVN